MNFLRTCSLIPLCAIAAAQTPAPAQVDGSYQPGQTRVAILPLPNNSGEKWQELKDRESLEGLHYLQDNFRQRGFVVVPQQDVTQALADLKIDLTDEEQYRRDVLYTVGHKLNATLVALVKITDTNQKMQVQFLSNKREGHTKIKGWLVDANSQKPIFSAKSMDGSSGGSYFAGLDKGSDRQVIATDNAIRDLFHDFWIGFKSLDKAPDSNTNTDGNG